MSPDGKARAVPEIERSLTSNRSTAELRDVVHEILNAIHAHTLGDRCCVWINAAGYSAPTRARMVHLLSEVVPEFNGRIGICNDAVGLLLARPPGTVVVIAGTGSVAMARHADGSVVTRGGDEWVVADYGSAFWLGLHGIRAAYQALEGGNDTSLLSCFTEHFSPLKPDEVPDDLHLTVSEIARRLASLGTDTKPTIASFARQVTRQAELGDDEAQMIVRRAVEELGGAASRVFRSLAAQMDAGTLEPRFLVSGSVMYNSRFCYEAFTSSLDQFLFDVREAFGGQIDVTQQMNGIQDALTLAEMLANDLDPPVLDADHSYDILEGGV